MTKVFLRRDNDKGFIEKAFILLIRKRVFAFGIILFLHIFFIGILVYLLWHCPVKEKIITEGSFNQDKRTGTVFVSALFTQPDLDKIRNIQEIEITVDPQKGFPERLSFRGQITKIVLGEEETSTDKKEATIFLKDFKGSFISDPDLLGKPIKNMLIITRCRLLQVLLAKKIPRMRI